MVRVDRASKEIAASPGAVYAALVDPAALVEWLPPQGMTGRFEHFDARPGGSFRLVLTYDDPSAAQGKSTADSDVSEARFTDLVPGERVVQEIDFVSDDPAFAGTMTMTWTVAPAEGGATVEVAASGVPDGIRPEDHAEGMGSSLDNLAAYLAR
ncbi:SRPBCC family protein [Glycomyces sp. NPDC047010]|uniref:SRPBCC family protein n=1 Tax=Glycomyces sp. NPDC047010 TaxID=3155023 RepID=UPI00340B5305